MIRLMHCLLSANVDASQSLAQYIKRPDLRPGGARKQEIENFTESLQDISLAYALPLYELFEQKCNQKVERPKKQSATVGMVNKAGYTRLIVNQFVQHSRV